MLASELDASKQVLESCNYVKLLPTCRKKIQVMFMLWKAETV